MDFSRSEQLYNEAKNLIPGGVNSPVRAFKSVGGKPIFLKSGEGPYIYDVDGNKYIDLVCSWGPLILGHSHPEIVDTISKAAANGTTFGASTELEVELAQMIVDAVPSIEMVRLVNSGTEALMSAIRLARGYTKRDKIIKFEGCYHGHFDALLAKAGSGITTFGLPDSAGVPNGITADTIVLPYNNIEAVLNTLKKYGEQIACIVLEPVAGNMGVILPKQGYLECLRGICDKYGIVLIFDEVITGFRVSYGGAQELYGVKPDLTALGKIIGGGLPVGAYGGKRDIMEYVAPVGPVYQAGTLSGNPLAVSAGIATLKILKNPDFYEGLENTSSKLAEGLAKAAEEADIPMCINRIGSMMTGFFTVHNVFDYNTAKTSDVSQYAVFFNELLARGVYIAPSQFEATFISSAHSLDDINLVIESYKDALKLVREKQR